MGKTATSVPLCWGGVLFLLWYYQHRWPEVLAILGAKGSVTGTLKLFSPAYPT